MSTPALEERFLQPPGWRWHSFTRDGRKLRFGTVAPQNNIPNAVVVCLPGLSEFGEKYFEVARTCLDMNLSFWVFDWMGQGKSDRYLKNLPNRRHSRGYARDVDDLHDFILGYIKHSAVHPDVGRIPMAMLAHSMGAHIGLHYMARHPGIFECAAFSAPLLGLKAFSHIPDSLAFAATWFINAFADTSYVQGFGDWHADIRPPGENHFSLDPARPAVHNAWSLADPALQVGGITYGWLYETQKSCMALRKKGVLQSIQAHCLLALAGHEAFADNAAIRKAASVMPHAKLLEFPESRHEILMERDEIRQAFFEAFHTLIKERIIKRPETLKPF